MGSAGMASGAGASDAGISGTGASSFFWQPASERPSNAAIRTEYLIGCFISLLLLKMAGVQGRRPRRMRIPGEPAAQMAAGQA
jgi:hypothetical protein